MSNATWAVKYRPQLFSQIMGQDMVNEVMKGIIKKGSPPASILCCGRTGTGKTTTLRVYAKAINCDSVQSGEPCNECELCDDFNRGAALDFQELDASTAGGVEAMRALASDVRLEPLKAKYRFVLIDEVHAMSKDGFNVLLKMIEEPPPRVRFGFATTEIEKVPRTIAGRSLRFLMRPVSLPLLKGRINYVCSKEGLTLPEEVVHEIAVQSNGQVRDAIMLTEQASYVKVPTPQTVRELVGLSTSYTEKDFILAMDMGEIQTMAEITNDFIENHVDVDRFINKVIGVLDAQAMKAIGENDLPGFEMLASRIEPLIEILMKVRIAPEVAPALFRYWAMTRVEANLKANVARMTG